MSKHDRIGFDPEEHVIGATRCPLREEPARFSRVDIGMEHGYVYPGVLIAVGAHVRQDGEVVIVALHESWQTCLASQAWDSRVSEWMANPWIGLLAKQPAPPPTLWAPPDRPDRIQALRALQLNMRAADGDARKGEETIAGLLPGGTRRPIDHDARRRAYSLVRGLRGRHRRCLGRHGTSRTSGRGCGFSWLLLGVGPAFFKLLSCPLLGGF